MASLAMRSIMLRVAKVTLLGSAGFVTWDYWNGRRNARCEALQVDTSNIPKISRHASGVLGEKQNFRLTLFQYQTCPFCSKVRAFMDYYGLNYDVVEVNPLFRTETKFSTYRKIPFMLFGDDKKDAKSELLLPDSSLIVSVLQTALVESKSTKDQLGHLLDYYPEMESEVDGKKKSDFANKYFVMYESDVGKEKAAAIKKEAKWRQWVDEKLVKALAPNIYQSPTEAVRTFRYLAEAGDWQNLFPSWQIPLVIYVGAGSMYVIGKRLKRRYKLNDDVRISLYQACDEWVKALGNRAFMGGQQPNLADLAAYGVLSAIEGCDAFRDLSVNTKISAWYDRMKVEVQSHNGARMISSLAVSN